MEADNGEFNPLVLLIALLLIVAFTAIFYQKHQWDQYEQRYRELLAREDQTPDPEPNPTAPPEPHLPAATDSRQKSGLN